MSRSVSHRLSAMPGPVALVGAGEFLPAMADFDAGLLASTGRSRPRVAILPTASFPDGEDVFQRWAAMGVTHFGDARRRGRTGPRPRPGRRRRSGRGAGHRRGGSRLPVGWQARLPRRRCSPGRRSVARWPRRTRAARSSPVARPGRWSSPAHLFDPRARVVPWPLRWRAGLGFVAGASVVPHYDAWPEPFTALIALQAPRGSVVLGIDEETADGRPRRGVAGPRPVAGHGLAGSPSRPLPAGETFRL